MWKDNTTKAGNSPLFWSVSMIFKEINAHATDSTISFNSNSHTQKRFKMNESNNQSLVKIARKMLPFNCTRHQQAITKTPLHQRMLKLLEYTSVRLQSLSWTFPAMGVFFDIQAHVHQQTIASGKWRNWEHNNVCSWSNLEDSCWIQNHKK